MTATCISTSAAYGTVVEAFVRLHTAVYDLKRRTEHFGG